VDCLISLLADGQFSAEGELSTQRAHLVTAKVVHKHWGEERWLVPEGSAFGFKLITVRAGMRTSLQYHRQKEEANLILCGEGRLHLADGIDAPVTEYPLVPGQIAHIRPGVVHRVEAVTELVIVEVSTPELDDVIRLEDEMGRGNGRIEAEHLGELAAGQRREGT
jgi:mannose-6-phosphate isomerase